MPSCFLLSSHGSSGVTPGPTAVYSGNDTYIYQADSTTTDYFITLEVAAENSSLPVRIDVQKLAILIPTFSLISYSLFQLDRCGTTMRSCTSSSNICTFRIPPCALKRDAVFSIDVTTDGTYNFTLTRTSTTPWITLLSQSADSFFRLCAHCPPSLYFGH